MTHTSLESQLFDFIKQAQDDYTQLWSFKVRPKSLELITPHSTISQKFVSVFILAQGNEYVITDGGYVNRQEYGTIEDMDSICYIKMHEHLEEYYDIKTNIDERGSVIYYKKTKNKSEVTSIIHDVASFVAGVVNSLQVSFVEDKESVVRRKFNKNANGYIKDIFPGREVKFNSIVGPLKKMRYSAVVHNRAKLELINYITGSNSLYFQNSLGKADMTFQLTNDSSIRGVVGHQVALIDNECPGYSKDFFKHFDILERNSGSPIVMWSEKEKLHSLLMQ